MKRIRFAVKSITPDDLTRDTIKSEHAKWEEWGAYLATPT